MNINKVFYKIFNKVFNNIFNINKAFNKLLMYDINYIIYTMTLYNCQ